MHFVVEMHCSFYFVGIDVICSIIDIAFYSTAQNWTSTSLKMEMIYLKESVTISSLEKRHNEKVRKVMNARKFWLV